MKNMKKVLVYTLMILAFGFVFQPVFAASQVNLNTATVEQLIELKGIGEIKAKKIVEYRTDTQFKTVNEVVNVDGIGAITLENIIDRLTVSDAKKE